MAALTSQILDRYPYSLYADSKSIQRGRDYFKEGRVWDIDLVTENKAICLVDGDSGEYSEMVPRIKSGETWFNPRTIKVYYCFDLFL
jgi:uncharacterized Zn finger protein